MEGRGSQGEKAPPRRQASAAGKKAPAIPKVPGTSWQVPSNYEVRSVIGRGAYGSVCEACDHNKGQLVAIKRLQHLFDDLIDCKRILRELAILSKIDHDNVVRLYDLIMPAPKETFDELYIVMELCDSDLKKLVKTDVNLTPLHINTLLNNLLVGLKYLHSAGIWHRDLKPANCLVNQDCSLKICDFGLSRAMGGDARHLHDLPNTPREEEGAPQMVGPIVPSTLRAKRVMTKHVVTRWYRAPELILLQQNYGQAIDVWSVGCIYAELMQMLPLDGFSCDDRGPLFPGTSCFPLSPARSRADGRRAHTRGQHDQLEVIFDLLGLPTEEQQCDLEGDAKHYLKGFAARTAKGIASRFPGAAAESLDMLTKMLQFAPSQRITVVQALEHPLLLEVRDEACETVAEKQVGLEFEKEGELHEGLLREYFESEVNKFKM